MLYLIIRIVLGTLLWRCEGMASHDIEALRRETMAQEVVDEEVV